MGPCIVRAYPFKLLYYFCFVDHAQRGRDWSILITLKSNTMFLTCPLPGSLTPITPASCPFRFDQIVKLLLFQPGGPSFANADAMKLLATWTPYLSANDDTRIVTTPIFAGFVIPGSEALTTGGNDNSTFNGIPEYNGEGTVTTTGGFRNLPSRPKLDMEKLTQFSLASAVGTTNLQLMMVNKDGYIFYTESADNIIGGIDAYNWRIGSVGSEGFNAPNITPFGFSLIEGWDRYLQVVKPNFNPLTALVNTVTT